MENIPNLNPFSKIALCLSGGGFRSAAYSLGVMKYLNRIDLLASVCSISTVSGGSLTGIKYALFQAGGKDGFDEFYAEMMDFFQKNNLHNRAVEILNTTSMWQKTEYKHKERNLINSFAIAYDEWLDGSSLQDLDMTETHIEEYIFNATDMNNAVQFRFKNTGKFGNSFMPALNPEDKKSIKLGDILAASSCFPGGFEPINFPSDFLPYQIGKYPNMSLMDGGIIDNQGTNNYQNKNENSLILIADVQSKVVTKPYKPGKGGLVITLFSLLTNFWTILFLGAIALFFKMLNFPLIAVFFAAALFLVGLVQLGIFQLLSRAQESIGLKTWFSFHPRRYGVYVYNRLTSFNSLAQHIFLKNNRDRSFRSLYRFTYRQGQPQVPVLIPLYRLTSDIESKVDNWGQLVHLFPDIIPNEVVHECVKTAAEFPTTLWFNEKTKERDLHALIRAGEMTACYILLCYVLQESVAGRLNLDKVLFYKDLQKHWIEYKIKH